MSSLPTARWTDGRSLFPGRTLPVAECTAFALNTFLCDVAVLDPQCRAEVLDFQVSLLAQLSDVLLKAKERDDGLSGDKKTLARRIVPLFFGLARAMGRFGSPEEPLFLKLFPKPLPPVALVRPGVGPLAGGPPKSSRSFSTYRSIIPQSLSAYMGQLGADKNSDGQCPVKYFRDFGSSFELTTAAAPSGLQYSVQHLETILQLARSCLLDKTVLKYLDELAGELYLKVGRARFPYKSFSE